MLAALASLALANTSHATAVFESEFFSSSSGTNTIGIGETISFRQYLTIDAGNQVSNVTTIYSADLVGAHSSEGCRGGNLCFPNANNLVTGWEPAVTGGLRPIDVGLTRTSGPANELFLDGPGNPGISLGHSVLQGISALFAFDAVTEYQGNGVRTLLGTLTIRATTVGQFDAGALVSSRISGVFFEDKNAVFPKPQFPPVATIVNAGSYTVHAPEPGTGLLTALGCVGFALMRRRKRA